MGLQPIPFNHSGTDPPLARFRPPLGEAERPGEPLPWFKQFNYRQMILQEKLSDSLDVLAKISLS
jgi:hypothetical protein